MGSFTKFVTLYVWVSGITCRWTCVFIYAFTWLEKVEYSKHLTDFLSQRNTCIYIRELRQGLIAADVRGAICSPAASLPLLRFLQQGVLSNRGKWHKRKISFRYELFMSDLGSTHAVMGPLSWVAVVSSCWWQLEPVLPSLFHVL